MSETEPPTTPTPILKWGDSLDLLTEERKEELAQRLWGWKPEMATKLKPGPFASVQLNGLEVFWLAVCALAGNTRNGEDIRVSEQRIRLQKDLVDNGHDNNDPLSFPTLYLSRANLCEAALQGANLCEAILDGADFTKANLGRASLYGANLNGTNLPDANLNGADITEATLEGADLTGANLGGVFLNDADLEAAILISANLEGASLSGANLNGAYLFSAKLNGADLDGVQLDGAALNEAVLRDADLRHASLDKKTNLERVDLTNVLLDGTIFDNTNLSVVDWSLVPTLQDETLAKQSHYPKDCGDEKLIGKRREKGERKSDYQAAARAYRRLAVALQANGMSDEAAGYAYRGQLMQRRVYWFSGWRAWGRWAFSGLLDVLAGYGYKPERSAIIYLLVNLLFAAIYYALGVAVGPHLSPYEAAVVSLTAFHGRGFFATTFQPGDPQAGVAAIEAVVGLLIEISFIATFTQRFFGSK